METIENRTLLRQTVSIDETHFKNCKLLESNLEYHGGQIIFEETELRACRYVFLGSAGMTFEFMNLVGLVIPSSNSLV